MTDTYNFLRCMEEEVLFKTVFHESSAIEAKFGQFLVWTTMLGTQDKYSMLCSGH